MIRLCSGEGGLPQTASRFPSSRQCAFKISIRAAGGSRRSHSFRRSPTPQLPIFMAAPLKFVALRSPAVLEAQLPADGIGAVVAVAEGSQWDSQRFHDPQMTHVLARARL